MAPIFDIGRWCIQRMKIWAYGTCRFDSRIPPRDLVAIARGPDDVGIGEVWNSKARFAAAHVTIPPRFLRIDGHAGAAHVPVILHVAVEIVGSLVVDSNVVHLSNGKSDAVKTSAVYSRNN